MRDSTNSKTNCLRLSIFQNPNIVFRRQFVNFFLVMWYSSEPVQVKPMISGNRVVFEDMKVGLGFSFPHRKTGKTEFCLKGQRSPLNPEFQENLSSQHRIRSRDQLNKLTFHSKRHQVQYYPCFRFKFSSVSRNEIVSK